MELAQKHNLKVIEDCAHALGATYKGQATGTFGDGSFFSFQAFKPLNTYGGGLAWVRDADVAEKVWGFADAEEWPSEKRLEKMELFDWKGPASPGAAKAMTAVQMPVYESLSDAEIERIGRLVREQARQTPRP
jgi:dTDP-4-amino-4,6-dideoxygalactose transaminase